ncbi:MAG: DUF2520 domain-containing protein [Pedobacter sp.]|nr:MAG: DUF2520 domain-containing protein [Pedobacter sp.]
MKVVLVGSGNVATHLALALHAIGNTIAQVWSRNQSHASKLADKVNAKAISNLSEADLSADFCVVSIKDDAVGEVAELLRGFKGIVVHTSGSVDIAVFAGVFERYGVLYPLQTFSIDKPVDFSNIPMCIEASDADTLNAVGQFANKLSTNVREISSEKRRVLHLAAVFACNFTNYLYTLSNDLLNENDLDFNIIRPLILETAAKVQEAYPKDVQTGPAIRNDEQTLNKHKAMLTAQPELLAIYQTLSDSIKKTKK